MAKTEPEYSPALLAAQDKLNRLRASQRLAKEKGGPFSTARENVPLTREVSRGQSPRGQALAPDRRLPDHLGWVSGPVSAVLRRAERREAPDVGHGASVDFSALQTRDRKQCPAVSQIQEKPIKLYPDLALGILRQEKASTARIWLLLRYLDVDGRGWLRLEDARHHLTSVKSSLRVCGWRQLRNLLSQGEGLFWQRGTDRVWLRSVAKVASALGVQQLAGRPVALSPAVLTQGIGAVRAHLYASFHSGRSVRTGKGKFASKPITRQMLRELSGACRRTQRKYEKRARVRRSHNYAVGPRASSGNEKVFAWQRGRAMFRLRDEKGKRGSPGRTYLAWQLPNSYAGPHALQPRGRQKRINRELKDLFMQGMTGNDEDLAPDGTVGDGTKRHTKRFYGSGRQAARAYNRESNESIYWCSQERFRSSQARVWYFLAAKGEKAWLR